jgi:hypothetical protein
MGLIGRVRGRGQGDRDIVILTIHRSHYRSQPLGGYHPRPVVFHPLEVRKRAGTGFRRRIGSKTLRRLREGVKGA